MNYKRHQRNFKRLIKKYDERTVRVTSLGDIDPLTGESTDRDKRKIIDAIVAQWSNNQIDGQMIKRGDLKILTTSDYIPVLGDIVTISGNDYTISEPIDEYNPGGVVLGYSFNAKR